MQEHTWNRIEASIFIDWAFHKDSAANEFFEFFDTLEPRIKQ